MCIIQSEGAGNTAIVLVDAPTYFASDKMDIKDLFLLCTCSTLRSFMLLSICGPWSP